MRSKTPRTAALVVLAVLAILAATSQAIPGSPASAPSVRPADARLPQGALIGSAKGLFRIDASGMPVSILAGTEVRKIVRAGDSWYFLTDRGILHSPDLLSFAERNAGIPVKTLKTYDDGVKAFVREIQEIKDLEADPYDPRTLVACTKDEVYLTRDGGQSWTAIPSPATQPGLKAVAVTSKPEGMILVSHPIKGPFRRPLAGGSWKEIGGDLGKSDPSTSADEISDIAVEAAAAGPVIWASNSFLHRIYRLDATGGSFKLAYGTPAEFAGLDSLAPGPDGLRYVTEGKVLRLEGGPASFSSGESAPHTALALAASAAVPAQLNALWLPASGSSGELSLSELWMVAFKSDKPYRAAADGRLGLYLQTHFMVDPVTRAKYDAIMTERRLDMVVMDMKDDFGRLRFEPRDPLVKSLGRTVNPLDVESFVREMKAKGRWLVARIVVFKDQRLYEQAGGAYAAWDASAKAPWRGYELETTTVPATPAPGAPAATVTPGSTTTVTTRKYYDEYWVDPYSEKVWEYNVAVAREMIARGFDEIQFDYIRFPTDGVNLDQASYRWKDAGMDKESALMSFLRYAREHIAAPISIDIYGANGWYRSGVRTGQDVELLSRYVDAICPMFYPSHFEQGFMGFEPAALRPYRIYRIGTLRNSFIARKKAVIRPWVQAFYLNVRYDREWYSPKYISLEVDGVRDSSNEGLTFWNNSGNYADIPVLETAPDGRLAARPSGRGILD